MPDEIYSSEVRAATSLARPGIRRTDADDLARVVEWFTEGTQSADLREARQVLAELRGDRAS